MARGSHSIKDAKALEGKNIYFVERIRTNSDSYTFVKGPYLRKEPAGSNERLITFVMIDPERLHAPVTTALVKPIFTDEQNHELALQAFEIFLENGEEKDCVQDREQGDCFHRFCDYEQVGMDLETHLGDITDLLSVDEII